MLLASALGLIKFLILAHIMTPVDYGQYVALFGVAAMLSVVMSFGQIEGTTKLYPRWWIESKAPKILMHARGVSLILAKRFALAMILALAVVSYGQFSYSFGDIFLIGVLGLLTALLALIASLYRAIGSPRALQKFNVYRSSFAFVLSIIGGWALGWQGALAGDLTSCILIFIYAIYQVRMLCVLHTQSPVILSSNIESPTAVTDSGASHLYLSNLFISSTTLLDKAWIGAALGASMAGAYSVIALIPQIAQLIVNIVAQYVGPLVIKFAHLKHDDKSRISALWFQAVLLIIFSTFLTCCALFAKRIPYIESFFMKYEISDLSLIFAGSLAATQIYGLIEFHLIAQDRETDILKGSLSGWVLFVSLFAVATWQSLGLEWFIASAVLSKLLQVLILQRAYSRSRLEQSTI